MKQKKDFIPIILYLVINILLTGIIIGIITIVNPTKNLDNCVTSLSYLSFILVTIILIIKYRKKLNNNLKSLNKKDLIFILISSILILTTNLIISTIFTTTDVDMNNQELLVNSLKNIKLLPILSIVIAAPFPEEMVFRYSIGTIIKNKIIFVIISSLLFGIFHEIGISTIIYIIIGAFLSIIYLKTNKNVIASTIAHSINNLISVIILI